MRVTLALILIMTGYASQYAPGVMERVIRVRQAGLTAQGLPQDLPKVDGYAAVPNCEDIGNVFEARPIGSREWETFLAVDCGCPQGHRFLMSLLPTNASQWQQRYAAIEVDYQTAVRWDTVGSGIVIEMRVPVTVTFPGW